MAMTTTERVDYFLKSMAKYIMLDWIADGISLKSNPMEDLNDIVVWRERIAKMKTLPGRALLDLLPTNMSDLSWIDHRVIDFVTSLEPNHAS